MDYSKGSRFSCDRAYQLAEQEFYAGRRSIYSSNEMLYIRHGHKCFRKCYALEDFYFYYGLGCNRGMCPIPIPGVTETVPFNQCSSHVTPNCDQRNRYRTITGECNNLQNPSWGKSETMQPRILQNAYNDGKQSPRINGCSGKLANERTVSNTVHKPEGGMLFEKTITLTVMQVGQFLAHDFVLTKLITQPSGDPLRCCDVDRSNPGCNPIEIPAGDPIFRNSCLTFSRSRSMIDCNGIRQQVNSQTSYIDLSMVYGAFDDESRLLRTLQGGRLKEINNKLPVDTRDMNCQLRSPMNIPSFYCLRAGDERANEQPGLSSIHTLFMREHNRLADGLQAINPHWDDERVYQEARKINIAQWQNIIYGEYLPFHIHPVLRRRNNMNVLRRGFKDTYDPTTDASVINGFGAGIHRYGHSLIRREIAMLGYGQKRPTVTENLEDHFFNPRLYHDFNGQGLEFILKWQSYVAAARRDRVFEVNIRDSLFKDANNMSADLVALNIHRGRDHGIPGYNAYRRWCGLSNVEHFGAFQGGLVDHDPDVAALLEQAYSCPEDIDLYSGMVSERSAPGVIIGPTAQCIFVEQFKRFRNGDRFFFERPDPVTGFRLDQLNSIKNVRLSSLFCLNTNIQKVQTNIFMQPFSGRNNGLVPCYLHNLRAVDLSLWRDPIQPRG
ncbi:hypothetical protein ACF0H5_018770 [Mactra antiquata]